MISINRKSRMMMATAVIAMSLPTAKAEDRQLTKGNYQPTWESLSEWECPEWFKDAKFGIWAHWGPQCEAEAGDWYARHMYYPGSGQYNYHLSHYGSPSTFGLKDLCNEWKAENWNPQELIDLYASVGARYFMMLANHHDNFDLWDSPYQEWNSVNIGPKRDLVGEWTKAARNAGLHTGVSVHASHTWTWMEGSQKFDGNLTKEDGYKPNPDGTEKWWKGYDPQELYAQNHPHSSNWENISGVHAQWDWGNGASLPDEAYKKKLMNRTLQLVQDYQPDMIYFDDTVLPFWGCDEQWGLDFLSSYYNQSAAFHDGQAEVVVTGKQLPADKKNAMLWDVERGIPDRMQTQYWQTCTCIGDWHYNQDTYKNNSYKSAATVIRMLVDVISKNGNLLLSIPVKGDGTIDEKERKVLDEIKDWMDANYESIYGTRVWKTFGEGPLAEAANPMNAQGFNEGLSYSADDVRFVQKDGTVYATIMAWPTTQEYTISSFSALSEHYSGQVTGVRLLGYGELPFSMTAEGLKVTLPETPTNAIAPVLAITTDGTSISADERMAMLMDRVETFIADNYAKASHTNTGAYNRTRLNNLQTVLEKVKAAGASSDDFERLNVAFRSFLASGRNPGGLYSDITECEKNLTEEQLIEGSRFSRDPYSSTRFGKPKNWTVENFKIPNGGSGTKEGIDNYAGGNALMLGVWDDRDRNQKGDLADARIYRTVSLPAGRYFFGGAYNTTYNISRQAYIFAADKTLSTSSIPEEAIAYYPIADSTEDKSNYYGIWFSLDKESDVILGWQADLKNGSPTQEFRVEKVVLLRLPDITAVNSSGLIKEIEDFIGSLPAVRIGGNTGSYPAEALEILSETLDRAKATYADTPEDTYYALSTAWEDFLASKNHIIETPATLPYDITEALLIELSSFTPSDPTVNTRFASPAYWTVENFLMPRGEEGVKGGLDKYEGDYALMLGIWDDRGNNTQGDLANARIYRKVNLPAGDYYFGAAYNALYAIETGYVFAATDLYDTDLIPKNAEAYAHIADNYNDHKTRGLFFTVETPGDYYLGWQTDLTMGGSCQEFRAESVCLLSDNEYASVEGIAEDLNIDSAPEYYNLQGIRISDPTSKGIYIVKQGSKRYKTVM